MTKQIGIMLSNLGSSQLAFYAIQHANKLAAENKADVALFYDTLVKPIIRPQTSIMNCVEVYDFPGLKIATQLHHASCLINVIFPGTIVYYVWDLEWLRGNTDYMRNMNILRNERLKLVARSESHAKNIENYCNKSVVAIVEDVNLEQFLTLE